MFPENGKNSGNCIIVPRKRLCPKYIALEKCWNKKLSISVFASKNYVFIVVLKKQIKINSFGAMSFAWPKEVLNTEKSNTPKHAKTKPRHWAKNTGWRLFYKPLRRVFNLWYNCQTCMAKTQEDFLTYSQSISQVISDIFSFQRFNKITSVQKSYTLQHSFFGKSLNLETCFSFTIPNAREIF